MAGREDWTRAAGVDLYVEARHLQKGTRGWNRLRGKRWNLGGGRGGGPILEWLPASRECAAC